MALVRPLYLPVACECSWRSAKRSPQQVSRDWAASHDAQEGGGGSSNLKGSEIDGPRRWLGVAIITKFAVRTTLRGQLVGTDARAIIVG